MKFASTTALALSLAIGTVAVTGVSPALAKKKDDAAAATTKQEFSAGFRQAAQPLQKALQAGDTAGAQAALPAAQQAASTPDDKFALAQIQYSIAQKSNDQAGASAAIDAMLASGKAPADLQNQLLTAQAQYAFNAGKFDVADRAFTQLNEKTPNNPEILTSLAAVKARQGQNAAALPYLDQAIQASKSAGKQADEDLYQRALAIAYDAKNSAGVIKYGQWLVQAYPTYQNWRSALQTFRDTTKLDPQADLDVMRLAKATNSLAGERDYYEYANSALNRGFPGEAKAVIDGGLTSNMVDKSVQTSKALAEIKAVAGPKVAADKASLPALDKGARAAADGKRALQTGDAYLGYGQFPQAAELYKVALQKGGVDAGLVNLHLGEALAQSGQKPAATEAFGQVTGPLQMVGQYWTIYADKGAMAGAPKTAAAPAPAPAAQ